MTGQTEVDVKIGFLDLYKQFGMISNQKNMFTWLKSCNVGLDIELGHFGLATVNDIDNIFNGD